jgi:hypothetical protein
MTEREMPTEEASSSPPFLSRKRKCPPSPPMLDLGASAVLQKSWEFASSVERGFSGRTLAPLTGSRLEAQLLVSLIEAGVAETEELAREKTPFLLDDSPAPLERSLSGIDPVTPTTTVVPGVSDEEWDRFREQVYAISL